MVLRVLGSFCLARRLAVSYSSMSLMEIDPPSINTIPGGVVAGIAAILLKAFFDLKSYFHPVVELVTEVIPQETSAVAVKINKIFERTRSIIFILINLNAQKYLFFGDI